MNYLSLAYISIITAVAAGFAFMQNALVDNFNIWNVLDKYGFPTAALAITVLFIWNRQKKADAERAELLGRNNELLTQLLSAVRVGNACKYINGEKENDG